MPPVPVTIHLPAALWRAVQALAPEDGDANTVLLRALEEYVAVAAKRRGRRAGKCQELVKALSTPVTALHLSARLASAVQMLNIRYLYELVRQSLKDLFASPNFGNKSLREVSAKLGTLGMTRDDNSHRATVVATVAASIEAARE